MAAEYVSVLGLRLDGRRPREVRGLEIDYADSGTTYAQGCTRVRVAIRGPREAPHFGDAVHDRATLKCRVTAAPFSNHMLRRMGARDKRNVRLAKEIQDTFSAVVCLDLFPRSQIDIDVQILMNDGGVDAVCFNAVTAGLVDAGIPMRDFVVSCEAGCLDGTPMIDLNRKEEMGNGPKLTVSTLPRTGDVISMNSTSKVSKEIFAEMLSMATEGCDHVFSALAARSKERTSALLASQRQ